MSLTCSVYDIKGSECCLSTGDLVKIVDKELQSVSCVDVETGRSLELTPNFTGVFKPVVDDRVYDTIEKLKSVLSSGDSTESFWFASHSDFVVGDHMISKRQPIKCVSISASSQASYAKCCTKEGSKCISLKIPISTEGEFYECDSNKLYSLEEVLQSPALLRHSLKCSSIGNGSYSLSPVYETSTIMQMRKDIVKMPSSLEVDVIDITSQCGHINFIRPLSLSEASKCEDQFPIVAEILESVESNHLLKNELFSALQPGQQIVIYKKVHSRKVLVSATKGRNSRFFFIHDVYQGKFRQRPREFMTVYDLCTKLVSGAQLNVVVTQDCESVEDCFPSLCVGDHLKVLHQTKMCVPVQFCSQQIDVLVCTKDTEDEEDKPEEIMLPLCLEGRFVEEVTDNKRYTINNIIQKFKLPCEVKVVSKDPSLATDPLASFASLRLEELVEEPVLLVSFLDNPSACFELPLKWVQISLFLTEKPVPETKELTRFLHVEELTESLYYSLRKELPSNELPPPRPPKREAKPQVDSPSTIQQESPTSVKLKESPPIPPSRNIPCQSYEVHRVSKILAACTVQNRNTYSPLPHIVTTHEDSDSEADYELVV
ncbi:protein THEMIS2 isoform X2 [Ascaphus truei]|uniref:protein THEMIS2 isoform X2 n=1 Tax=Ascaphus truei TaxID=8439 RepID=UPI003F59A781